MNAIKIKIIINENLYCFALKNISVHAKLTKSCKIKITIAFVLSNDFGFNNILAIDIPIKANKIDQTTGKTKLGGVKNGFSTV